MLIETEQLYRYYGNYCAVDDVSFTLSKGEILGFLGPNGAGKSTTMQMICGNLAPSAGSIRINGLDMLDNPKEAKAELGYLPETPPVHQDMTVDEFLVFCARLHKITRDRVRKSVENTK
ncbi:MAG: ABC transporter ATP-binding protein, partial [Methylococcales bacterium]